MNKGLRTLVIAAIVLLLSVPATALAIPMMPLLYHGSVTIDGLDAPVGTTVTAEVDGVEIATNAPDGTTEEGTYILEIVADEGDTVVLKVEGVVGGESIYPNLMEVFEVVLDLEVGALALSADAHGPYSGTEGGDIALTGSASGGQSPYTYAWDLDNDSVYDDATGASPSHSWATAGIYTIGLQVTDDNADTATDTATVTVIEEGGFDPGIYDEDEDGEISKDEAQDAVDDYDAGLISRDDALAVIKLYFS